MSTAHVQPPPWRQPVTEGLLCSLWVSAAHLWVNYYRQFADDVHILPLFHFSALPQNSSIRCGSGTSSRLGGWPQYQLSTYSGVFRTRFQSAMRRVDSFSLLLLALFPPLPMLASPTLAVNCAVVSGGATIETCIYLLRVPKIRSGGVT